MRPLTLSLCPSVPLSLLLLACGGSGASPPAGGGAAGGRRGPSGPVPVEVVLARTDTVVEAITATGQIEAVQSIELRPEVDGRLVQILVREGAVVARGTPLFKVDDAELKAQVARAQADRDLAQQALTRTRQLLVEKAAAPADVERAEAQMRGTQAGLDLLELRLDRTVVRAPFAGVAGRRLASLGDYVNNSSRLITLQTVNPQRAVFQVPERYAARLLEGQIVVFRVAALGSKDFSGSVDFVDPVVALPGRTITVKALVPNPDRELQAGMFIEARLQTELRADAVVIPEDAVTPVQGAMWVWVVSGNQVERRPVTLGVRMPGIVEVRSGIAAGDQVVVGGGERLVPGAEVQVLEHARASPPSPAGDTAARVRPSSPDSGPPPRP
ncbi:MAG TPA: efflux RND transporter periplasmic adaptor subunit [Gemmatimonadales bacterium]|nr:efflux RND transporter periplasmic adaptor subunit [Gemmatimonadales bacterium]